MARMALAATLLALIAITLSLLLALVDRCWLLLIVLVCLPPRMPRLFVFELIHFMVVIIIFFTPHPSHLLLSSPVHTINTEKIKSA
jgi:hypothetical protein